MSQTPSSNVQSNLHETRFFAPAAEFSAQAHVKSIAEYEALHARSINEPETFWVEQASQQFWFKKWDKVLEWNCPDAKWFVGGKTNLCHNAVDRQVEEGHGDLVAILWEGEPTPDGKPEIRRLTYKDLQRETAKAANMLKSLGVQKGDVVTVYLPMIPELAITILACARIGAVHSVIFGGFSAQAIKDRIEDGQSKIVITADGGWRRGKIVPLKENVDEALKAGSDAAQLVKHVVVVNRCNVKTLHVEHRDLAWEAQVNAASDHCPCAHLDSEDLAFVLYTSGSTGKPKGIMHSVGGYMVHTAMTAKLTFDLKPGDMYWCTADIGWITGHSYMVYGILPNKVTSIMYEGAPDAPDKDRFWDIIERHRVTKFYTAPTAIRTFMKWGRELVDKHDLSSLRLLGTVGEPINPEAWIWYHEVVGKGQCPIVDTWWQTETGGHMLTPLPGATTTTPGSCTRPMLGIDMAVVDETGQEVPVNEGGILVCRKPWPSMLRGVYGNRERFIETYWSKVPGMYTAGDGARKDEHGNFWIMGRIDDIIIVAGHNIGTMEVESGLVSHPAVAEAAVVGFPHDVKGNALACFCILRRAIPTGAEAETLKKEILAHVRRELGPTSVPDKIYFTEALPKTRSGKIMRRLLKDVVVGKAVGQDVSTLEDRGILDKLAVAVMG